ncbi:hypothetical protein K432DRAFT_440591 [Lepidopterella palustris CBS 459.81]|uniref:FAD-binding domain-containing protein n=1 Tax=Lepidopterella palustris CBS 459.81 TaxID=1314670 RepID=A0A8E2EHM1_9PEZI|nr:hypothetical protein K432DRAFT_440591 [Lepidopterella palustris CBS 459.81]
MRNPLKIIVIRTGIGRLACAIACRYHGLDLFVLERAKEIVPVEAGIQIPPNATRAIAKLGLLPKSEDHSIEMDAFHLRRYEDGILPYEIAGGNRMAQNFWLSMQPIHSSRRLLSCPS